MRLEELREQINKTDIALTELLVKRMQIAEAIAKAKAEMGMATLDEARQQAVKAKVKESTPEALSEYILNIYDAIMRESVRYQEKLRSRE